jgi:hypothetical protein
MIRMGLPIRIMVGVPLAGTLADDCPATVIRQQRLKASPGRDKSGPYTALAPTDGDELSDDNTDGGNRTLDQTIKSRLLYH